jgi:hypothetical protein
MASSIDNNANTAANAAYTAALFSDPRPWWNQVPARKRWRPRNVSLTGAAYTNPRGNVARDFVR